MKVGILGSGDVAKSLAKGFAEAGHTVRLGTRDPHAKGLPELAQGSGGRISVGSAAEAAQFGEVVVLALLGSAVEKVLTEVGPSAFAGKLVIDPSNPLEFDASHRPHLFVGWNDSLGERVQRALPKAHVVKAFNTVGHTHMYKPQLPGGPPDMFLCGNDAGAKRKVGEILTSFGWAPLDLGGIESARLLEPLCVVWVTSGIVLGTWDLAFKLIRK
jgi:predicted dinucleotide-binding enzyme